MTHQNGLMNWSDIDRDKRKVMVETSDRTVFQVEPVNVCEVGVWTLN